MNVKEHVQTILENEGLTAAQKFLSAHFDSKTNDQEYFHRYTDDELFEVKTKVTDGVNAHKRLEEEIAEERKALAEKLKDSKKRLEVLAQSAAIGGIERTGMLFTIIDNDRMRAVVFDMYGRCVDDRPLTETERQKKIDWQD